MPSLNPAAHFLRTYRRTRIVEGFLNFCLQDFIEQLILAVERSEGIADDFGGGGIVALGNAPFDLFGERSEGDADRFICSECHADNV